MASFLKGMGWGAGGEERRIYVYILYVSQI